MIGAGVKSTHNFCWGFYVKILHGKVQNPISKPVLGRYSVGFCHCSVGHGSRPSRLLLNMQHVLLGRNYVGKHGLFVVGPKSKVDCPNST